MFIAVFVVLWTIGCAWSIRIYRQDYARPEHRLLRETACALALITIGCLGMAWRFA